ncbi:Alpha/beta hydrolase fold-1 [Neofusicoccum parvum]|uniref:Alpha/beta hydrolase fold-1 n=1 Tax=Neofusicoccum parvum TaxID=310453 RepID=A0ACB5SK33_9PEZI|nr:Alpha/beta hydrolase fold-1 [Neofusicoccum parvum]GME59929.1 Alpha/beta hydrolase fold-1 [Neofusicoccum parvum]
MPSLASSLRSAFLLHAGLSAAFPAKRSGPACSDVSLSVTISAENRHVPGYLASGLQDATLTLAGIEQLLNSVGDEVQIALVNGTYSIAGRFCEPEVQVAGREDAIQLLVHGITYDRNYWSGGGSLAGYQGDKYSWLAHASKLGYPTLAIDRLGNGASDHPDPVTVVQKPAHVEVAHQVVQALRRGDVGGRAFSKISYVGHSYGSLIGNGLVARYPDDVDALILTGFTNALKPAIPGVVVTPLAQPAPLVDEKFRNLSLGYMAMSLELGARGLFYTNTESEWDADVVHADWLSRGTYSLGEAISTLFVNDVADDFTKPVLILTGHKDQIFCGVALPLLGEADCTGHFERTQALFPNAEYSTREIANTGHCLNFHYSANETFTAAHDFLNSAGF